MVTRTDSSGTNTMLRDGNNSTVGLVNSSGTLATQFAYEPFGKTTFSGSGTSNLYRFTGRELDGTGLYFMRARYYNPILQRFLSPDPIGFNGGSVDLYSYAFNSPTNFIDPLGTSAASAALGALGGLYGCSGPPGGCPGGDCAPPPAGGGGGPACKQCGPSGVAFTPGSGIGGGRVGVGANERLTAQLNASSGLAMVGGVAGGLVGSLAGGPLTFVGAAGGAALGAYLGFKLGGNAQVGEHAEGPALPAPEPPGPVETLPPPG
jgi:RHS repeat-associated protein